MGKKKKKQKNDYYEDRFDYDDKYEELHYNGDVPALLNRIADSMENFLSAVETYVILDGERQESYKENYDLIKGMVKKLRKGKLSPLNVERINDALDSGQSIISGEYEVK